MIRATRTARGCILDRPAMKDHRLYPVSKPPTRASIPVDSTLKTQSPNAVFSSGDEPRDRDTADWTQRAREPKRPQTGTVEPAESPLLGAGEPTTEGRSLKKGEVLAFFFGSSRTITAPKVLNGEPLFRPMTTGSAVVTLFELSSGPIQPIQQLDTTVLTRWRTTVGPVFGQYGVPRNSRWRYGTRETHQLKTPLQS